MRLPRCAGLGFCVLLFLNAGRAIERLPVEDFAREPEISHARLSPDGKYLAFIRDYNERAVLHVTEIGSNEVTRLDIGEAALAYDTPKPVRRLSNG